MYFSYLIHGTDLEINKTRTHHNSQSDAGTLRVHGETTALPDVVDVSHFLAVVGMDDVFGGSPVVKTVQGLVFIELRPENHIQLTCEGSALQALVQSQSVLQVKARLI